MNKLNVGDYVRTKYGIAKIIAVNKDVELNYINGNTVSLDTITIVCDKGYTISESYPTSPNIIDLLEVGDVLVIKDFVDEACMIFTDIYLIQNEQQLLNIKNDLEKNKNKKLYSIVTKEQFENISYKVGE